MQFATAHLKSTETKTVPYFRINIFRRRYEITCSQCIEIETTRHTLTKIVATIPIRRTATAPIQTRRLMSQRQCPN